MNKGIGTGTVAISRLARQSWMMGLQYRHNLRTMGFHQGGCRSFSNTRTVSSSDDWVKIDLEVETGIAVMTLNRPPANSLSLEMCQAISQGIKTAEEDHTIQALIVTSALPKIFCAGLDLKELYQPDSEGRLPLFWKSFQQLYLDLYGSRLATLAAIDGHAPAAGCMLALSCDYRIMSSKSKNNPTIGLNESQVGIVAPKWLGKQYIDTIGHRQAELALSLGTLFHPQQAKDIGLIDEVVMVDSNHGDGGGNDEEPDDVITIAKQRATEWVRIPPHGRREAKELTRGEQLKWLLEHREEDAQFFCQFVTQKKVQRTLGMYLDQLAKRKK